MRVFKRRFDTHAKQWRYAVEETQIDTDWILRLDADYQVSPALLSEFAQLDPNASVGAYRIQFDYAIFSHKLLSSLYPANTILLRKGEFCYQGQGTYRRVGGERAHRHARRAGRFMTIGSRPDNG